MSKKIKTARLSIFSNLFLIALKVIAGLVSGSVSILSEAIHSGMDLLASLIAYFSLRVADKPADKEHPYGHGKFENISGVIEALLILGAAGWIVYEAIHKLISANYEIQMLELGIGVMAISAIVNFFVSRRLYKVAKATDSIALEADALHLKTDVYTSLGICIALIMIRLTGWNWLDPIIALMVAMLIVKESYVLLKAAYAPLLDSSLKADEVKAIEDILQNYPVRYHDLKTRKAGQYRFAEMHIELPSTLPLQEVHDLCDDIEEKIKSKIGPIEINIHVEPIVP
ncbi:MAG: cation diffusion facilitator family transporter [Bacteroidales bacterium]|nr:cation diffusion facilitator family transporter [Bacteroidales bacterium]HOK98424.1 cation diffusion facilitator family transporter [Bacteroidales bacterium]HPO65580.1 cation diffusion facilitator family transporter [Bacteroidales bacterium]